MNFTRYLLSVSVLLFSLSSVASASSEIWIDEPETAFKAQRKAETKSNFRYLRADVSKLRNLMSAAPLERVTAAKSFIDLPLPDGTMHTFVIEESPIMSADTADKFPQFKTYRVYSKENSKENKGISGRLDLLPTGFHAYLTTDEGVVIIDPDQGSTTQYRSFYKHDYASDQPRQFSCGAKAARQANPFTGSTVNTRQKIAARSNNQLINYRLAVAATHEYSLAVTAGTGNIVNTQAAIMTAINRVNAIYERDLGISLQLVPDDDLISTVAGQLTNNNPDDLITESTAFINAAVGGAANYDIGHVFSTGAGGLATLGGVCTDIVKAEGVTGISDPVDDVFYIDFVAHEIGHQFGADHTFNGTTASCSGNNRNAATAFEPGSGSTIMAYAGICGAEDVQSSSSTAGGASDDTFHAGSVDEIYNFTRNGAGRNCDVASPIINIAPVVNAGLDYIIPAQTAFELTGSATDANSDTLIYQWDEMDTGASTDAFTYGTDLGSNPLFRSFSPTTIPVRTFPRIETIVSGVDDKAEVLPDTSRDLNFRLTVRDQKSGFADDGMKITVDKNSGSFKVLSAATTITLDVTQPQVIEWDAACTGVAPVSCANVDILLSTDSGTSFTMLLAQTANDGEETVSFPAVTSSTALIKVACTDNIFFDVNDKLITLQQGTGSALVSTGAGSSGGVCTPLPSGSGGGGSISLWFLAALFMCQNLYRRMDVQKC